MVNHVQLPLTIILLTLLPTGCRDGICDEPSPSNIRTDEDILFFPTYGHYEQETSTWRFDVHGKVFEPEYSSMKRAALIAVLQATADFSNRSDNEVLEDRIRPFIVDNERGKSVTIEITGEQFTTGVSDANGHFSKSLAPRSGSLGMSDKKEKILAVQAVLPRRDLRIFSGRVHLIAPQGVSVISDIDDTIKLSQVTDKSELMRNTFLREFRAIEGMPELYTVLAKSDVAFHYVSGSPWQLYQPLDTFMSKAGFPKGTFHLKHFRLKGSSAFTILSSQQETKLAAINPLLKAFPNRKFILIGDSGEQDPEIYGRIARESPLQIVGIYIRNVTGEKIDDERFLDAFAGVPSNLWNLFGDASQIKEEIIHLATTKP
ncbi:hypothetical protein CA13_68430 [Planctomycetes bacterium CA13]|uniref:Phosphatidate phosphatase APP1 catalytic domain-containing protein n=1 Tax=Novipirellula herctigrandis TaxID=2527986 RepID=A0A5C5YNB8_9BACT|nr:hypothetical protein CA13_68430 [Planctomycetes bacterium CA13]